MGLEEDFDGVGKHPKLFKEEERNLVLAVIALAVEDCLGENAKARGIMAAGSDKQHRKRTVLNVKLEAIEFIFSEALENYIDAAYLNVTAKAIRDKVRERWPQEKIDVLRKKINSLYQQTGRKRLRKII